MSNNQLNQIRNLSVALFISGSFNIILIAFCFFWVLRERPPTPYFEQKPLVQKTTFTMPSSAELLKRYKGKTYEQLLPLLSKKGLVEDGLRERDLVLGVLITYHDFDLERALGTTPSKRVLSFDEGKDKVTIYPSLNDSQYEILNQFIKMEKWPFKPKGLFHLIKNERSKDPSLIEAFYLTPEFFSMEALFKGISKEEILQMVVEGNFGLLSAFNEKQRTLQDLSSENRQKTLLSYINEGSQKGAEILLKTDFDFAAKRLSDSSILSILRKLNRNTEETEHFLSVLLGSPRGDEVRLMASTKYQELTGKSWEPLISREPLVKAPALVFPKKEEVTAPKIAVREVPPKKSLLYIVQDGDTLWKIGKRFKVSIEEIRSLNKLKSDSLKPGSPLKVPAN